MLNWVQRWMIGRGTLERSGPEPSAPPPMRGEYALLYTYLAKRYADTVVLTFGEIEDLLGFTLPDLASRTQDWWTSVATTAHTDAWLLANRTARPNLLARTVVFERAATAPGLRGRG